MKLKRKILLLILLVLLVLLPVGAAFGQKVSLQLEGCEFTPKETTYNGNEYLELILLPLDKKPIKLTEVALGNQKLALPEPNPDSKEIRVKIAPDELKGKTDMVVWCHIQDCGKKIGITLKKKEEEEKTPLGYNDALEEAISRLRPQFENSAYNSGEGENRIHLFFDRYGYLLNDVPPNANWETSFTIHIFDDTKLLGNYQVEVTEGDYSPSDLSIRPSPAITSQGTGTTHSTGSKDDKIEYGWRAFPHGPVTTEFFKFKIVYFFAHSKEGQTKTTKYESPVHAVRVNKLYHVGLGVSLVNTWLTTPEYRVTPLETGGNTITALNDGSRVVFTFNAIWYWSVLQDQSFSIKTRGRDIYRDDPAFTFKRVFPTLGISLDQNFRENIFLGFAYEFARGGSIVSGVHYGATQQLTEHFEFGQTYFAGTEILITKKWEPAFFIGINVDTRIFNALFGRGQ